MIAAKTDNTSPPLNQEQTAATVIPPKVAAIMPGALPVTPLIIKAPRAVKGIYVKNRRINGCNGRCEKVTKGNNLGKNVTAIIPIISGK